MIVPAEIARQLVAGRITQVRIPINSPTRRFKLGEPASVQPHRVFYLATEGTDRSVRYTTVDRNIGQVVITDVHRSTLGNLTPDDLRREGYPSRDSLLEQWKEHGRPTALDAAVWVLTVRPHGDPVRLLAHSASQAGDPDRYPEDRRDGEHHDDEHDYATSRYRAIPDEPEAVDPDRLDKAWAEHAERRRQKAREQEERRRKARSLARRARELALNPAVDPATVEALEQHLDSIDPNRNAA